MNWKEIIVDRQSKAKLINKEIRKLNKQIKNLGTICAVDFIAEEIEKQFGYPCRLYDHRTTKGSTRMYLFEKDSTPKQIRYLRDEKIIGAISISKDQMDTDPHMYVADSVPLIPLPSDIELVFKILTDSNAYDKYVAEIWKPHKDFCKQIGKIK